MTTYSRTFEITQLDQRTLKTMIYRERWMQSVFECLVLTTRVKRASQRDEATVAVTMLDSEQIQFENWLDDELSMGKITSHQTENEQACKARVAFAYKEPHHELNSWLDFGN
jgi:hypothetical protein